MLVRTDPRLYRKFTSKKKGATILYKGISKTRDRVLRARSAKLGFRESGIFGSAPLFQIKLIKLFFDPFLFRSRAMAGNERNLSTRRRIEIRDCDATMSNIVDLPTPRRFSITRSIALVSSSKRGRLRVGGRRQTPPFPSKNHDRPRRRDC